MHHEEKKELLSSLHEKDQTLRKSVHEVSTEKFDLEILLDNLKKENANLKDLYKKSLDAIKIKEEQMTEEKAQYEKQAAAFKTVLETTKTNNVKHIKTLENMNNDNLNEINSKLVHERELSEKKINDLIEKVRKAKEETETIRKHFALKENEEIDDYSPKAMKELRQKHAQEIEQLMKKQSKALEEMKQSQTAEIEGLNKLRLDKLATIKKEHENSINQLKRQHEKVTDAQKQQLEKLNAGLGDLETLDTIRQKLIEENEKETAKLNTTITSLEKERESLLGKISKLQKDHNDKINKIDAKYKYNVNSIVKDHNEKERNANDSYKAEIKDLETTINIHVEEIKSLQRTIEALQNKGKKDQKSNAEVSINAAQAQSILRNEVKELTLKLENLKTVNNRLVQKLKSDKIKMDELLKSQNNSVSVVEESITENYESRMKELVTTHQRELKVRQHQSDELIRNLRKESGKVDKQLRERNTDYTIIR
jgi:hypothetical protein